jgi:hypothetical protein
MVRFISDQYDGELLSVDPRPLMGDTRLMTLHSLHLVVPDLVSAEVHKTPFAAVSETVIEQRRRVLRDFNVPEGDIFSFYDCPGILVPPDPDLSDRREQLCPQIVHHFAVASLVRVFNEATKESAERSPYVEQATHIVRVIKHAAGPRGSYEGSADYFFTCTSATSCDLLGVNALMVVE